MRPISAVTTALIVLLGGAAAEAANPTILAETGGFLLGNAQRCGVAVERVERAGNVTAPEPRFPANAQGAPTALRYPSHRTAGGCSRSQPVQAQGK